MTRDQAGQIVARLHAAYPHPPITTDRLALLVDEIGLLADAGVAAEAATGLIRNGTYFPKISEFRAAYHAVASRRRDATVKLEEPRHGDDVPTWVQVWTWARWMRDPRETRALPQERPGYQATYENGDKRPTYLTNAEYEALETEWTEAGAPKWKPSEILRTAGITR